MFLGGMGCNDRCREKLVQYLIEDARVVLI